MRIINLTWHDIKIVTQWWNIIIPKIEWFKLQIPVTLIECGDVYHTETNMKIPIYDYKYTLSDEVLNMFAPKKRGTIYVTSRIVADTTKRDDFYITWAHIKIQWTVIGTKGLQKNPFI